MKIRHVCVMAGVVIGVAGLASAQPMGGHQLLTPKDIKWGPAPPSTPPGAQAAVLYGDLGKEKVCLPFA